MKKRMTSTVVLAAVLVLIAGCTSVKPGAYEKVDEDRAVNTIQYRFNPDTVNKKALEEDVQRYCAERGFDKVEPTEPHKSRLPGLMKVWYQCNYKINN